MSKAWHAQRLGWEIKRLRWRLGTFGLLGVVLLLFSVAMTLFEAVPLARDLHVRSQDLERRAREATVPPSPAPATIEDNGYSPSFTTFLHSLFAMANKEGIATSQVAYKAETEGDGKVERYFVALSMKASYPQLRMFSADLRTLGGMRLEHVTISRGDIGQTTLDVRVELSFAIERPA
ncbi:hypothetical protein SAMN04487785_109177 [Dyella jiangningensis]|uniref:hypothetical protein n=1 Tax=Dyella sp. AtDHG13 TaxID=1938897 RepID=UPI00088AAC27|nr:hypothetical protein [Dyella sp. AtDHG13]PXV57053.1 hypothetical protein BDW41_108175 [Dyella sp. AtDHG13]SDK65430.1 hypothetical protein SAMN04487785_109177 [Dyella jiangningensis]